MSAAPKHYPRVVFVPDVPGGGYRAVCAGCGWQRKTVNAKRENAVRAARRHCREAR